MSGGDRESQANLMATFTAMFIGCLVLAVAYGVTWLWALAAFFGFAAIMTQIEVESNP